MKTSTRLTHEHVATIGDSIGFAVGREVSDSLLKVRLDKAYQPRVDLLWSIPLSEAQRSGISWSIGCPIDEVTHLPIVGIEIEGSMPTTKTMAADLANLAALGAPLGLLVVSELGERNIYRRSVRAVRSVRRAHGDLHILPVEAQWLRDCVEDGWQQSVPLSARTDLKKKPAGGETRVWSRRTREAIRAAGEAAGFVVAEPFVPPVLAPLYDLADKTSGPLQCTTNPLTGESANMKKHGDYLTRCEIDLAWLMPLPAKLPSLLNEILRRDPFLRQDAIVFPDLWTHVPVVGFEVESTGGKHAGGGLLNLAAYSVLGITVVPDEKTYQQVTSTIRTYQPTLGLRNIFVKTIS